MDERKRELLKKADHSVKTTEAWWAFINLLWDSRILGPFMLAAPVIGAAINWIFGWVAAYGWAGWVLAGVAGFLVVCALVLVFCGVALAVLRFLERWRGFSPKSKEANSATFPEDRLLALERDFTSLAESVHKSIVLLGESVEQDRTTVSGSISRLSTQLYTLDGQINTPHGMFGGSLVQQVQNVVERQNELDRVKDTLATLPAIKTEITKLQGNHFQFSGIILKALRARDAFALAKELNDEIIATAQILDEARSRPLSADEWAEWRNNHNVWLGRIRAFCNIGRPYDPEINRIEEKPSELYRPENLFFDASLFPDGNAVHDFQSFRIVMSRYNVTGPEVLEKMAMHSRV